MVQHTFPRKLRLLSSSDFCFVFQQPKYVVAPQLILLSRKNQLGYPRLGLAVAKKKIKLACKRNHYKRLMRESFRYHRHKLPAMDFLAIAKKGIEQLDNHAFVALLGKLWNRYLGVK